MKRLTKEIQQKINGGWCLRSNRYYSHISHYYGNRFLHNDYYDGRNSYWYFYGG